MNKQIPCPVCRVESEIVYRLPAEEIRPRLAKHYRMEPSADIVDLDYGIASCPACTLVFADPMAAGSAAFYDWVTAIPGYHPKHRWEWGGIAARLSSWGRDVRLLEVGCGEGALLDRLRAEGHQNLMGIDLSGPSVAAAKAKGLDVVHGAVEQLLAANETYDIVVLSHVLEHVAEPRHLMETLVPMLRPGGEILVCLPYSPLSLEIDQHEITNLPPHHLTRWNLSSLRRLALIVRMELSYLPQKPRAPLPRALTYARRRARGSDLGAIDRAKRFRADFLRALKLLKQRERMDDGQRAGDRILAVFTKPRL